MSSIPAPEVRAAVKELLAANADWLALLDTEHERPWGLDEWSQYEQLAVVFAAKRQRFETLKRAQQR